MTSDAGSNQQLWPSAFGPASVSSWQSDVVISSQDHHHLNWQGATRR